MIIERDAYLRYGIEIPVRGGFIDAEPLHDRTDRIIKAIRNDQTTQASANIGYFSREQGDEPADQVWLSLIMNFRRHGILETGNSFAMPPSTISAGIDLYDPESERMLRVIECIGPMATEQQLIDDASNFSVLSQVRNEIQIKL